MAWNRFWQQCPSSVKWYIIGRAEALPILCVRCVRWERERERERYRERDGSDVTLVALKLAMSFALFPAKKLHLSIGEEFCTFLAKNLHLFLGLSSWMALSSHFPLHSSKQFAFFVASFKRRDRESKHRNKRSNFRLHRPSSHRKNESN